MGESRAGIVQLVLEVWFSCQAGHVRRRVLLSEASSLTAREHVTVLGRAGVAADVLDSDSFALARWSRWSGRRHRCPPSGRDPRGYLAVVAGLMGTGAFDALLPTHEQAWLFSVGRALLPPGIPLAVAAPEAFGRVQSKVEFARLLDELNLPQPRWWLLTDETADEPFPYYAKAAFSTAGRGVRLVRDAAGRRGALDELSGTGPMMAQEPATGQFGQVQALFSHGRLIAVHTCVQVGTGFGGSAAARLSVDAAAPREHVAVLGAALGWHGGLTLDYIDSGGGPRYIECNPRTVEPGNAAASGVDLPGLTVRLSRGEPLPDSPVTGRPGVRTHGLIALALGAADRSGRRRAVTGELVSALARRGCYAGSAEQLTPVIRDPLSLVPLAVVATRLLANPRAATSLAGKAVSAYSVTPDSIARLPAAR
jgi:hypothetical protein